MILLFCLVLLKDYAIPEFVSHHVHHDNDTDWIINLPEAFEKGQLLDNQIIDTRSYPYTARLSDEYYRIALQDTHNANDGESIDIIDHFFWGFREGIVLEMGALDGTPATHSMSYWLEHIFNWKRILIEANPIHSIGLKRENPNSLSVHAAVCNSSKLLHDAVTREAVTSGILEFMNINFLQKFHNHIYEKTKPKGNISNIQHWNQFPEVTVIHCLPMYKVLKEAKVNHINLFILDVEGAELEVLQSIDWRKIRFDVIVVETKSYDPTFRPADYPAIIESFLTKKGYKNCCGQVGRNTWFVREGFEASRRPGLKEGCYRGEIASQWKKKLSEEELHNKLRDCEIHHNATRHSPKLQRKE
eukprot:gene8995-9739_t